jgi:hypothetical protein
MTQCAYPPWYDSSYRGEGTVAHLDLAKNMLNVAKTIKRYQQVGAQ